MLSAALGNGPANEPRPHPPYHTPTHPHRAAGLSAAQANLKLWGQCGGQGGNCKEAGGACVDGPVPGSSCPTGSSCLKQSNWYYQCLPTGEPRVGCRLAVVQLQLPAAGARRRNIADAAA